MQLIQQLAVRCRLQSVGEIHTFQFGLAVNAVLDYLFQQPVDHLHQPFTDGTVVPVPGLVSREAILEGDDHQFVRLVLRGKQRQLLADPTHRQRHWLLSGGVVDGAILLDGEGVHGRLQQ